MQKALSNFVPSRARMSVEGLQEAFIWHLRYTFAIMERDLTDQDCYQAFSLAIRERIVERWIKTHEAYLDRNVRHVCYLSVEFLIGRLLATNVLNLRMEEICQKALEGKEINWDKIRELEVDAGLGNGGLGRLAACFMDSMSTLNLPCMGYGLRYDYGIFRQLIVNGMQVEEPDDWRRNGYPWEIKRLEKSVFVQFGGETVCVDVNGRKVWRWSPAERVQGIPYDIPIVGYGGKTVNTLRLWSAASDNEFDFQDFNRGSYVEAVEHKVNAENLTKVLYPNDNIDQGKELRLRQQYFFVACTLRDILRRYRRQNTSWDNLGDKVFIQLNDTHPTLAIPELMRILLDEEGLSWEKAQQITYSVFGYTNHTVLPEALEKWNLELFERLLPRHMQIIYEINGRFLREVSSRYPGDIDRLRRMSIIEEGKNRRVRMANLALVASTKVNGVAKIHSDILRRKIFRDFAEMWPDKFVNITNGITQRRWLLNANPRLAKLITSRIGDKWITDLQELRKLEAFVDDDDFLTAFQGIKRANKERLATVIQDTLGVTVDVDSIFDVQVKRLHEYKRQLLLILYVIMLYNRLVENPDLDMTPRTFIFSGKAAPGYILVKQVLRLIHNVAETIAGHPVASKKLKVVFLPDYRVSLAEIIIPAADVSEQISLAGNEASGTGNMKLMLNGALTVGTMDGANVEIYEEVGKDNIFIFGLRAEEVAQWRPTYSPWDIYFADQEIQNVLDTIRQNAFSVLSPGVFDPIVRTLLDDGDYYMHLADLRSYADTQDRVAALYRDQREWSRRALLNVARAGKFSSDRTITEYARLIWDIEPMTREDEE
ncbi:MAG: glycogen/starch/alpha-glucan phosphorylase [Lentisphaerae bacterium]|jgi:starch phosphorylase|nr:glycogen/starch/alpha-glucan phosphorylase [Lentisphaerota bacterium]